MEHDALEACEVGVVEVGAEGAELAALVWGERGVLVGFDGIDLVEDASGDWFEDGVAVFEVGLIAVIVGRVVAGGEHDAAGGVDVADGEGEFRGGAVGGEEPDVDAAFGHDFGGEFSEFAGEVAGIVAEDDGGTAGEPFAFPVIGEEPGEAAVGAGEVEEVEGVGADAGELGAVVRGGVAAFCGGDDFADGASAEPAGAEGEFFEEAVVEFGPLGGVDEFCD